MKHRLRTFINKYPRASKAIGLILVILGLLIHLIPLMPGGWIIFLGLELMGIRLLVQDKIMAKLENLKIVKNWRR